MPNQDLFSYKKMDATTFSPSEAAFLQCSFNEVMKVWSRGFGQANFSLNISDGHAELKMNFSLGRPQNPHVIFPLEHNSTDSKIEKKQK